MSFDEEGLTSEDDMSLNSFYQVGQDDLKILTHTSLHV